MPTARRAPSATLVRRGGERLLIDCGEGSLRRIFGRLTFEVDVVELAPEAVLARDGYALRTFPARHGRDAIGYALVEEERPGRFDVEAADALGVPSGRERRTLQDGEQVTLADGRVVAP